jgi:Holliday junction resolvase-like predicted endonuclease
VRLLEQFKWWGEKKALPLAARHGQLGERAAKKHLQKLGLKYLTANFRSTCSNGGEIDLVFRDDDCLMNIQLKLEYVALPLKILIENLPITLEAKARIILTDESVLMPKVLLLESGKIQRAIMCKIVEPIG